jgi:hypothetical protein
VFEVLVGELEQPARQFDDLADITTCVQVSPRHPRGYGFSRSEHRPDVPQHIENARRHHE